VEQRHDPLGPRRVEHAEERAALGHLAQERERARGGLRVGSADRGRRRLLDVLEEHREVGLACADPRPRAAEVGVVPRLAVDKHPPHAAQVPRLARHAVPGELPVALRELLVAVDSEVRARGPTHAHAVAGGERDTLERHRPAADLEEGAPLEVCRALG
jgi:hypothetical protein